MDTNRIGREFAFLAILALSTALIQGCGHTGELKMTRPDNVRTPDRPVLVFFVDGVNTEVFDAMLSENKLPNIQTHLIDRGCRARHGLSCVPSITYAVTASINTGRFPGHHDIMGNKWFDRQTGKFQNYCYIRTYQQIDNDLHAPTIFEMLNDRYTVTIQTANRYGASRPFDNWMSSGINWFFNHILEVDQLVAMRFEEIAANAQITGVWPEYILAYFPAVDEIGHRFGSNSQEYQQALINVDTQIGKICRSLQDIQLLDKYTLALISDHGHAPSDRQNTWIPDQFFRDELGLRIVSKMFEEDGNTINRHNYLRSHADAVVVNGGSRRVHVHLRSGQYWTTEPTYQDTQTFLSQYGSPKPKYQQMTLPQILAQQEPLRLVAVKVDDNRVEILYRDWRAMIERKIENGQKLYRYQPVTGDPLTYSLYSHSQKLTDGQFHDSQTWLQISANTAIPDFVPQIVEMFDSPRAGQIVFFADTGWNFSTTEVGGHGSIVREDMIVPFIIAGPEIRQGEFHAARLVDLVPTILDIMNLSDRANQFGELDGISRLPEITATQPTE